MTDKDYEIRFDELEEIGLRSVSRIADYWKVDMNKLVGNDEDKLLRMSYTIGIFTSLNTLYDTKLADKWITQPNKNKIFGGVSPYEYIRKEGLHGLKVIRQHLDALCAGN